MNRRIFFTLAAAAFICPRSSRAEHLVEVCGTCRYAGPWTLNKADNEYQAECFGAPPTPVLGGYGSIKSKRPMVGKMDPRCALYEPAPEE